MSYFQSFHFSIFCFPEAFFAKRCISGVLRSGMSYFQSFHFSIFSFPEAFFPQNAAFPEFCALECLISKVFIFRFLASQKLFSAKRCISGVLHSGMSYFQSFHFSIFSFPEAIFLQNAAFPEFCALTSYFQRFHFSFLASQKLFFSQNAAFPEFCTLECLISKVFIFLFLASEKFFFLKTLHFRCSGLLNFLFPNFFFFFFDPPTSFFSQHAVFPDFCILECLISKVFIFRFLASQKLFFCKTLHFRGSALWNVLFPKFSFFDF